MRVRAWKSLAILAVLTVVRPTFAGDADSGLAKTVDAYMTTRLEMGQFSGAVLVAVGDRVVLRRGYGFADIGWPSLLRGVALTAGHLRPVAPLALTPPEGDAWLYSTVDDLYTFSRLLEGSALIPPALAAEIATADADGYGAGWFVDRGFDRKRMRHNGSLPGYVSDFIRFPDEKATIVLVSNLDRARMSRIGRDVTAIVLGRPFDMPVRGEVVELDAGQIAALTGDYVTAEGKTLNIRKEPDYLTAELKGQYLAGLIPLSPTEMYFPLADGKAVFTLGADGRAAQVNMRFSGEDHVAKRAQATPAP